MGLDMYLTKRTYVKNWDYMKPEQRHAITVQRDGKDTHIKPERISYVTEQVAYWRKANAIHLWFVKNVQDGVDDCGDYDVGREQLLQLKEACDQVLAAVQTKDGKVNAGYISDASGEKEILEDGKVIINPEIAATVLPTQGGFFFGCTDYDEGYIEDLKVTSEQLAEVLAEPENEPIDYVYHASW